MDAVVRFYAQKTDNVIIPLPGQKIEEVFPGLQIKTDETTPESKFFEIFLDLTDAKVQKLNAIDTDNVLPGALAAARDYNETVLIETANERKENCFTDKHLLQDVIDRVLIYGDDFLIEMQELFKKFDIVVDSTDTELGKTRIVKQK